MTSIIFFIIFIPIFAIIVNKIISLNLLQILEKNERTFFFKLVIVLFFRLFYLIDLNFFIIIRLISNSVSNIYISYLISLLRIPELVRKKELKLLFGYPSIHILFYMPHFRRLVLIKNQKNYAIFSYLVLLGIYSESFDLVFSSYTMIYLQIHYYNTRLWGPKNFLRQIAFIICSVMYLSSMGICIFELYCSIIIPILTCIFSILSNSWNELLNFSDFIDILLILMV